MVVTPIDFEKLPPLYNPSVILEMASAKPQPITKTISALDATNPNSLKTSLDKSTLQSPSPNKKEPVYSTPVALSMIGMNLVGESVLSGEYVNFLADTQTVRVPVNIAIQAYEDVGEPNRIVTLIIVA